jgi:hypothetical protein
MGDKFVGGLRVQFPNAAGVPTQRVITMPYRPYKVPLLCGTCGVTHTHKTYHIDLDAQGIGFISREIGERLKEGGIDFTVLNVVKNPPKIKLNIQGVAAMFRVEEKRVIA